MIAREALAVIDHNSNVGRAQVKQNISMITLILSNTETNWNKEPKQRSFKTVLTVATLFTFLYPHCATLFMFAGCYQEGWPKSKKWMWPRWSKMARERCESSQGLHFQRWYCKGNFAVCWNESKTWGGASYWPRFTQEPVKSWKAKQRRTAEKSPDKTEA